MINILILLYFSSNLIIQKQAMKKMFFTSMILLLSLNTSFAQKKQNEFKLKEGSKGHRLYVSFINDIGNNQNYERNINAFVPQFRELSKEYNISIHQAITISPAKIAELEALAVKNVGTGKAVSKLKNIVELEIENPTNERLLSLAKKLQEIRGIEYCNLVPLDVIKPPGDIMTTTPLYEDLQMYTGPIGVNMDYAHDLGLIGEGIKVRDIEFGFNGFHEDLNEVNASYAVDVEVSSMVDPAYVDHGTAVFGVVYADNGNYGISGMAYGAEEMIMYSEYTDIGGYDRVNAIEKAIEGSTEGDVVIYELQAIGSSEEGYCPAEYQNVVWDLTKAATDSGIVIVAAAGNGNQDLDDFFYEEYMSRGDSGAIIVGAGSPDEFHNRLEFSTYGSRVDVHAWGYSVFTTGYGNQFMIDNDPNQSYTYFSGTSSATPIVASCVIVLQSKYYKATGKYLTGIELREILKTTGVAQGESLYGNIGPLPNMPAAIAAIDSKLGLNEVEKNSFIAYPNPVTDKLNIISNFSEDTKIEVYNSLGQLVYNKANSNNVIDFGGFSKGVYFVKITDNNTILTRKIMKN